MPRGNWTHSCRVVARRLGRSTLNDRCRELNKQFAPLLLAELTTVQFPREIEDHKVLVLPGPIQACGPGIAGLACSTYLVWGGRR